ncbi:hypothetical protein U0070_014146 [Myodes glareolus]|uniref:Uncharacterized protein n=1 Tax=Myodes glareolus TaxID=447135 RepID=A0AAW0JDN0_MYOGA
MEGENVLGVSHIFESFNDSFVCGTDVYGVAHRFKEMSVPAIHVRLWATERNRAQTPGLGMHSVLRALAC